MEIRQIRTFIALVLIAVSGSMAAADDSTKLRLVRIFEEGPVEPDAPSIAMCSEGFPGEWVVGGSGWILCPRRERVTVMAEPAGPRIFFTVDGQKRLGGVVVKDPEGLVALREEVAKGTSPLIIWSTVDQLKSLPPLPAGREYALDLIDQSKLTSLDSLTHLKNLHALRLGECWQRITDLQPLSDFTDLTSLHISGIKTSNLDLSSLAGMTKMKVLTVISSPGIIDVDSLRNMPDLTLLDLRGCSRLPDISGLRALKKLYRVRLSGCSSLVDLSPLAESRNLTHLDAAYCKKIVDLSPLAKLTKLTHLDLSNCENITDLSPLAGLRKLKYLNLRGLTKITDLTPLKELTTLEELRLNYCANLSEITPLGNLKYLKTLGLHGCTKLSDITSLSECKELTALSIGSRNISDISSLSGLTKLMTLNLENSQVADIKPLAGLTDLRWLNLRKTNVVDLVPLAEHFELRFLELRECNNMIDLSVIREILVQRDEGIPPGYYYFRLDVNVDERLKHQLEELRKVD